MSDSDDDLPADFEDVSQPVTDALMAKLAGTLQVSWPDWYLRLILAYGTKPPSYIFSCARSIYQRTIAARSGLVRLIEESENGQWREVPWPNSHLIVGEIGDGDVVIDTTSETGDVLLLDRETGTFRLFFNISAVGPTPELAAESLRESEAKDAIAHREKHAAKPEPEHANCPRCGKVLRTAKAQQCFECGANWRGAPAAG